MFKHTFTAVLRRAAMLVVGFSVVLIRATGVFACSVCQGDPNSKLVKGAEAGVLLMVVVTYGLLLGMVGLGATWFVRHRRRHLSVGTTDIDDAMLND